MPGFCKRYPAADVDVIRVDGKLGDELIHPLPHPAVKSCELRQVGPDGLFLRGRLLNQPPGHHVLPPAGLHLHLGETVLQPVQPVCGHPRMLMIQNRLQNTGQEPQLRPAARRPDLSQKLYIRQKFLVCPAPQIILQIIHHQEQPMAGKVILEPGHHPCDQLPIPLGYRCGRESVGDSQL